MHILVCSLEEQRYGIDLGRVDRGILAVAVTSIPNSPAHVLGALNNYGEIIPVMNLRVLLGLPLRPLDANDHFILCTAHNRSAVIWADRASAVRECTQEELIPAQEVIPDCQAAEYVLKENDEIVLLLDLDRLIPVGN